MTLVPSPHVRHLVWTRASRTPDRLLCLDYIWAKVEYYFVLHEWVLGYTTISDGVNHFFIFLFTDCCCETSNVQYFARLKSTLSKKVLTVVIYLHVTLSMNFASKYLIYYLIFSIFNDIVLQIHCLMKY